MAPPISATIAGGFGEAECSRAPRRRGQQRHQREQRHHRHVLEQQDREGALAVGLLQVAAFLQDAQRDRGGGEREREARDQRAAPVEQAGRSASARDRRRGEQELRDAEAEDVAPHREQARQLQFEPDQEQQHHDAEFGDGEDAARACRRSAGR